MSDNSVLTSNLIMPHNMLPQQLPMNLPPQHQVQQVHQNQSVNMQQQQPSHDNVLILSNIPRDLTIREANIIFSLVIDDISFIEIIDRKIYAHFKNQHTCVTTSKLLNNKYIFGAEYLPVKVEFDSSISPQINHQQPLSQTLPQLNNLHISPPNLHINTHNAEDLSSQNPSQNNQASSSSNAINSQPNSSTNQTSNSNASIPPANNTKRQSIGNQRSRFVFSDPFASHQSQPPSAIDLTDISNKPIFLDPSQDVNNYDNIVSRDPWSAAPSQITPRTPSINAPFEWNQLASSTSQHSNQQQAPAQLNSQAQQASQSNGSATERRRTSSAFFNNSSLHPLSSGASNPPTSSLLPTPQSATAGGIMALPLVQQQQQQQQQHSTQTTQPSVQQQPIVQLSAQNQASALQGPSASGGTNKDNSQVNSSNHSPTNSTRQSGNMKDVPDLSLLARVPPPANPADQNPPCNTLYVGNLPPDATEQELRSLFSPQKGFRRLSFRTKNQSSSNSTSGNHNHGPMCFVEFEDVAHATRALAELYGRTLPRPNGGNGKGGIRLSFSKNPLGVRGPGNPRRSSGNPGLSNNNNSNINNSGAVNSNNANSNSNVTLSSNTGSQHNPSVVGNYGYLNFNNSK
mgnify:CR=1 FL=1